jgi:HEAT repeat protein
LLRVHPGEWWPLLWLTFYATAAIGGVLTIGFSISTALYLSQVPATATPLLFAVTGAVVAATILIYHRLSARIRLAPLTVGSTLLLALIALGFRALLASAIGDRLALLLAFDLFIEAAFTLTILQLWSYAAQVFDPRQARRLFGLITIGGTAANMLSGLLVALLVGWVGTANILFVIVLALLVCALCAWRLRRWLPPSTRKPQRGGDGTLFRELLTIGRTPLLRGIALFTVLLSLLVNLGAYQLFLALQRAFAGSGEAMAAYLGVYEFAAGLAALLLHLFISRRLIRDRGIFLALLIFPLAVAVASGAVLAVGGALLAVTLIRAADPALRRTLSDPAMNVLFLPLPAEMRSRVKALMEVLYAVSFSVAGLLFLVFQQLDGWGPSALAYPLLALPVLWWLLSPGVRRAYLRALGEGLRLRRLEPEAGTLDLSDGVSRAALRRGLEDPDPLRVLHTLGLLERATDDGWLEPIRPLLRHPDALVRREAATLLRGRGGLDAETVAALIGDNDDEVRVVGIGALFEGAQGATPDEATLLLADPARAIRTATLRGMLGLGEGSWTEVAPHVAAMLVHPDAAERRGAATLLATWEGDEAAEALAQLLADPDPEVCRAAAAAIAEQGRSGLLEPLMTALERPDARTAAASALASYGEGVLPELGRALAEGDLSLDARVELVAAVARVDNPTAEALLLRQLDAEPLVRSAAIEGLAGMASYGRRRSALLQQALKSELAGAYRWALLVADLQPLHTSALLDEALERTLVEGRRRLLWLLAALYGAADLAGAARNLGAGAADPRLVEILDTTLDAELRPQILPLFEGEPQRIATLAVRRYELRRRDPEARLAELAAGEGWLAACALYEIGQRDLPAHDASLEAALEAASPLLREAALAGAVRRWSGVRLGTLLERTLADPDPNVRAYARAAHGAFGGAG